MTILPRILLHLVLTLSLLAAACLGLALHWDAIAEMRAILGQGRDVFQDMESLRSRFETLNTAWKTIVAVPDLGKSPRIDAPRSSTSSRPPDLDRKHPNDSPDGDEKADDAEKAFRDQLARDVLDAGKLYAHLRTNLASLLLASSARSHSGEGRQNPAISLPLLEALFGKVPDTAAGREGGLVPPNETASSQSDRQRSDKGVEVRPDDAIDWPLLAGMAPWSEAKAVSVREEMDQAYNQLDTWLKKERDAAFDKARRAQFLGLTSLVITAPLTILSSFFLIRAIRKPLQRLMSATEDVTAGRFDIHLPASGKDEISRLASAFNKMSAELARAKRREADFLSVAAHELKTPLTLIRVFAGRVRSVLLPGTQQAEAASHLDRIETEVDHLNRKVLDLLDLGVIEAGQLTLDLHELAARGFLTMAAGAYRPVAAERKIHYEIAIDPAVPVLKFDPDRLNQVIRNLLDNALKFTPPGGRVRFGAKTVDGTLELEVSDTGPGIPPQKLEEIFEKYARARAGSVKEQKKGTGLGLAVARGIVVAHGGTIEARSTPGKGSAFVVRLPYRTSGMGKEVA